MADKHETTLGPFSGNRIASLVKDDTTRSNLLVLDWCVHDGETKILNVAYYSLHLLSPRHFVVLNDESPSPIIHIYIISNYDPKVKNYFT